MHNKILKTAAFTAASLLIGAQSVGAVGFAEEYEYKWSSNIGTEYAESLFAVEATNDGYVAVGAAEDGDTMESNAFIVKYNLDGTIAWQNKVGANKDCTDYCFDGWYVDVLAVNDGYIAVGTSAYKAHSDAPWYTTVDESSDYNGVIVKYNLDGSIAWGRSYDYGGYDDFFNAATIIGDGQFVVAGSAVNPNTYQPDALTVAFDADGDMLWENAIGGSGYDEYYGVANAGWGIIASGTSDSDDGPWSLNGGDSVGIVSAFDFNGQEQGTLIDDIYGDEPAVAYGRVTASDDKFFVIRNGNEIAVYESDYGELIDIIGPEDEEYVNEIAIVDDGFVVVGTFERSYGYEPMIAKYDFDGNKLWTHAVVGSQRTDEGVFNGLAINGDTLVAVGDGYANNQPYWNNNGSSDGVIAVFSLPSEAPAPGVPSTGIATDNSEGAVLGATLSIAIGVGAVVVSAATVAKRRKNRKVSLRK